MIIIACMLRRNKLSSQSLSSLSSHHYPHQNSSLPPSSGNSISIHQKINDIEVKNSNKNSNNFEVIGTTYDNNNNNMEMNAMIPPPPRSESHAYANHSNGSALLSKINYYIRYNTKAIIIGIGMVLVILVMIADNSDGDNSYLRL